MRALVISLVIALAACGEDGPGEDPPAGTVFDLDQLTFDGNWTLLVEREECAAPVEMRVSIFVTGSGTIGGERFLSINVEPRASRDSIGIRVADVDHAYMLAGGGVQLSLWTEGGVPHAEAHGTADGCIYDDVVDVIEFLPFEVQ